MNGRERKEYRMKKWMKTALVLAAAVCLSVAAAFTALAAQTFQITASIGLLSDWFGAEYSGYFTFKQR